MHVCALLFLGVDPHHPCHHSASYIHVACENCMQNSVNMPPPSFEGRRCGGHGANGANFFVPCLVEGGTMPLVLKTPKTFFVAKPRYRYYGIHTSTPPPPPDTHTPSRYACGSSGLCARPPLGTPPRLSCQYPPPHPPRKF